VSRAGTSGNTGRPERWPLWRGRAFPAVSRIPLLDEVTHTVVHRGSSGDGFLHGAAIVHHAGTWHVSWGSSPVDENSLLEREYGRRGPGRDGARRWGPVEVIGPNLAGREARSHGVFHVQDGELWSLVPRFGRPRDAADADSTFPGLVTDAFRFDRGGGRWELAAEAVARDFWPMDAPTRLADGRWIMGGLTGRQNPVVATSHEAPLSWERTELPRPAGGRLRFAETTVLEWPECGESTQPADFAGDQSGDSGTACGPLHSDHCTAVVRYSADSLPGIAEQVALVSHSADGGRTWTPLAPSNLPMTASKPYAGHLSTGQAFLVCNVGPDRHTLVVAVTAPRERAFSRVWRILHGASPELRLPGRAKSPQWSYPYAHEHDGHLYVVYSIGKEDCGLSIIPLHALAPS
jgi:hypothetical protein